MRRLLIIFVLCSFAAAQGIGGKGGIGGKAGVGGGFVPVTNATFVSSGTCAGATSAANCAIGSISIPSSSIIVVSLQADGGSGNVLTVSDSNGDTPSYCAAAVEATDNFSLRLAVMKAGATVTTVTPAQSNASGNIISGIAAWYSPGSLTVALDQCAGQDQPNTTTWTSGNTSTLAGSNDLVVGSWAAPGVTSTYSDGGTQRSSCNAGSYVNCALEDRNVSGTSAVAASGTFSGNTYAAAAVIAIK